MALPLKWLVGFSLALIIVSQSSFGSEKNVLFQKQTISVGPKKIKVELAQTEEQHAHGLMFRKKLATNEGMLFVFDDEAPRSFWMKNTLINLSIGYFSKDKKLVDIQEMTAMNSIMQTELSTYPSKGPAMYALEMSEGWFNKNSIAIGARLGYEAKK